MTTTTKAAVVVGAILIWVMACAVAQDSRPDAPIDWQRAQNLNQRSQRGQQLSPEDKVYLDKAKAEIAQGRGPNSGAAPRSGQGPASRSATSRSASTGAAPSPGSDAPRVPPSRGPDKEVVYKKVAKHQVSTTGELKLYVYLPADWKPADKRPAIVFFHGGGWEMGTPEQFYSKAEYLSSRGMVAFCAEYSVKGRNQSTMDKSVEDARSAMRFVRSHAADWGVDGDKIVSAGGSSGGHLAAAVALFDGPDDPADDLKVSPRPQAMILFNPPMDMDCLFREDRLAKFAMMIVSGSSDDEKKKVLKSLSPIEYVKKDCPPMLMMFGRYDDFLKDARAFAAKSLPLGNRVEVWSAPRIGHGFFNGAPWHQATMIAADEFLASLGYVKGPPTMTPADAAAVMTKEVIAPQTSTAPGKE